MNAKIKNKKDKDKYDEFSEKYKDKTREELLEIPIPLGLDGLIYVYYLGDRLRENN